jgi:amidase
MWNLTHKDAGTLKYGQSNLDISDEMDVERHRARYEADRKQDLFVAATHGIDEVMRAHRLDALLFPGPVGAAMPAKPGYPTVMVPFAMVPNAPVIAPFTTVPVASAPPFPAEFAPRPGPFGVSFTGLACGEPRLIGLAYAFEQATRRRVPPPLFP